jgi:hypothetical protein
MAERSEQDIDREVERLRREIELLEREAQHQGLSFSSLSEEDLARKTRGETSRSPFIFGQGWSSGVGPGSSASYSVSLSNPDPTGYYPLFVTIFFGAANFLDDIGEGLSGRDLRWPYLSSQAFGLASGATTTRTFQYTTPTNVPRSTYIGNSVFWRGDFHDRGTFFDRCLFDVTLF